MPRTSTNSPPARVERPLDPAEPSLDKLEKKLLQLKREYDLFLAGRLRVEPGALRSDVEREILRFSRYPFHSTAARFRMNSLAHRFRALETQMRNLLEIRVERKRAAEQRGTEGPPVVVVDRAAIDDPKRISSQLQSLHAALLDRLGERPAPSLEVFQSRLLDSARSIMAKPGPKAVRFTLSSGENEPKLRGEIVSE